MHARRPLAARSLLLAAAAPGALLMGMHAPAAAQSTVAGTIGSSFGNQGNVTTVGPISGSPGSATSTVTLGNSRTVLNWTGDFSLGQGDTLNFQFVGRGDIVLNKVDGGGALIDEFGAVPPLSPPKSPARSSAAHSVALDPAEWLGGRPVSYASVPVPPGSPELQGVGVGPSGSPPLPPMSPPMRPMSERSGGNVRGSFGSCNPDVCSEFSNARIYFEWHLRIPLSPRETSDPSIQDCVHMGSR